MNNILQTTIAWIILCMCPAYERPHYNVTSSLIGRAHTGTQNNPCNCVFIIFLNENV